MAKELPEPLLPPDVDLRDYPDMLFAVQRFCDSTIVSTRPPEEVIAAVMLWCKSWHQVPAASLPASDVELAPLAGYGRGVRDFKRIRAGAIHGLILCSDGRYWHPVVAEKAAFAWNDKLDRRHRKATDRARKFNAERKSRGEPELPLPHAPYKLKRHESAEFPRWHYIDADGKPVTGKRIHVGIPSEAHPNSSGIPVESAIDSGGIPAPKEKGSEVKEREGKGMVPTPSAPEPPPSKTLAAAAKARPPAPEPKTSAVWDGYATAYTERYGTPPVRNAKANSLLSQFVDRVGADEAPAIAAFYVSINRGLYVAATHTLDLLIRDAEALRTAWATRRHTTDTEARMADKTQARGNVFEEARRELKNAS